MFESCNYKNTINLALYSFIEKKTFLVKINEKYTAIGATISSCCRYIHHLCDADEHYVCHAHSLCP